MEDLVIRDGVAQLTLAAGKANAMSLEVLSALDGLVARFEASDARAAVLIGYERFFSAGLALPKLIDLGRHEMQLFIETFNASMLRVFQCARPIVAAINGHAIAGGCVLALQCDHRVMAEGDFKIGLNEVQLGIGLPSLVVETLRLAVPPASLVPIALEGRLFSPSQAHALGLVDELVAPGELTTRAHARAVELASVPASGFSQVKRALRRPAHELIERGGAAETERWLDSWFSPEARERLTQAVARLR